MLRMNVLLHLTIYGLEFGGNVNYCELWGWWKGQHSWQATEKVGWRGRDVCLYTQSCNRMLKYNVCLYSGNVRFESHLEHRLRSIVIFFSHIRQVTLWPRPSTSSPIKPSLSSDAIYSLSCWQHR
jgi:hypothetical protein